MFLDTKTCWDFSNKQFMLIRWPSQTDLSKKYYLSLLLSIVLYIVWPTYYICSFFRAFFCLWKALYHIVAYNNRKYLWYPSKILQIRNCLIYYPINTFISSKPQHIFTSVSRARSWTLPSGVFSHLRCN